VNVAIGRKFARVTTDAVVRVPALWRVFRPLMRRQFDELAAQWDAIRSEGHLASYERALESLPAPPRRALDLGTGTGDGATAIARRFSETEVVGADLSEAMIEQARQKLPSDLQGRVRFEVADASSLPYENSAFDLVALANMIPFFDEVDRVLGDGGHVLFAWSAGAETPIYVPPARLRRELETRGFTEFAEFEAGPSTAFLARKGNRA